MKYFFYIYIFICFFREVAVKKLHIEEMVEEEKKLVLREIKLLRFSIKNNK